MDGQMFFKKLLSNNSSAAPIQFSGDDDTNCFPVSGKDVKIVTSDSCHEVGSAKLHIKNIVNYGWEHKYYPGQVVAHDKSGKYVAYSITTPSKGCGIVRVLNKLSTDRILIKGMVGPVVDLSFSHSNDEVVIGIVDSYGNLFVHKVVEQSNGTSSEKLVEIIRCESGSGHDKEIIRRLVWCPYVPDPEADGDMSGNRMLVLTHGPMAEIWSLDAVLETHGSGPLAPSDVEQGLLEIKEIGGDIIDAAFSPTGEAVAVAVNDGTVKFFQVYMPDEGPPRCLKSWTPRKGAALSSLLWLDDHTSSSPDTRFWKFVITGCNYNSEIKVWCSTSWNCLQTIKFLRPDSDDSEPQLKLKAVLDPTAKFLILSDIDARLLYILNINQSDDKAEIVSVAEFACPASILSLSCVSAGLRHVKMTTEGVEVEEDEAGDNVNEAGDRKEKTVVKMYFVQPKSLQECSIIYDNATDNNRSLSVSISDDMGDIPNLSESLIKCPDSPGMSPKPPASSSSPRAQLPILPPIAGLAEAASKISLLSPEQFQSPPVTVKQKPVSFSGNSSPSREVAGILDDCVQYNNDEIEDVNDEDDEEDDAAFQDIKTSPPPVLNTSMKFPTPPPVTSTAISEDLEKRLESLIMKRMESMEKNLEVRARKDNQAVLDRIDDLFVTLSSNVNRKVEDIVTAEIKRTLPNIVKKSFDGVEKDINAKLSGLESKVAKELSSGQSRDLIGRAVANNVSGLVETSYTQAFANQVTAMERAFGVMLRQINDQFLAGTREYEAALARRMEVENIEIKEMVSPVVTSVSGINNDIRQLKDSIENLKHGQNNVVKMLNDKNNKTVTGDEIRRIVHKEVSDLMSASRNNQHTPDSRTLHTQNIIKTKIQKGQFNDAFQTALSSSDLHLVIFTCENVNTTQVFNQSSCPLSQSVLLSLIQQLSVDLSDKTEIKHAYLHEALANLDPMDPTTKMHMKSVLKQLELSLQKYIQENPNSKMTRNLKILSMAASSELQRFM